MFHRWQDQELLNLANPFLVSSAFSIYLYEAQHRMKRKNENRDWMAISRNDESKQWPAEFIWNENKTCKLRNAIYKDSSVFWYVNNGMEYANFKKRVLQIVNKSLKKLFKIIKLILKLIKICII